MDTWIRRLTTLSEVTGRLAAWMILPLTFAMVYEVFARYFFSAPTTWAFDTTVMLYGAYFMLGAAYTLARDAHVRGDVFYRHFSPRTQALIDLVLYLLVFFPAMYALTYAGWSYFWQSFLVRETSPFSPYGRPIYPLKFVIPLTAVLLSVQGLAQVLRCVAAIRTNRWPGEPLEHEVVA